LSKKLNYLVTQLLRHLLPLQLKIITDISEKEKIIHTLEKKLKKISVNCSEIILKKIVWEFLNGITNECKFLKFQKKNPYENFSIRFTDRIC